MSTRGKIIMCNVCGSDSGKERLPRGWHRDARSEPYCPKCWAARYILRAVTIPVSKPVKVTWNDLREAFRVSLRAAVRLSNWAVRELAQRDVVRTEKMKKLPPMPTCYLYPGSCKVAPELMSGTRVAILHAVEQRYRRERYAMIWLGKRSFPSYRYDRGVVPIRSQDWRALLDADGAPCVSVPLGGQRIILQLRRGRNFARQHKRYEQLVDGQAVAAELALYETSTGSNDHRTGTDGRDSGGQRINRRLLCKLVLWLPRESKTLSGRLYVRTDSDALLIALDEKNQRLWIENCDHVRRWTTEHARRLQRWSEDQKAEQRPTASYQSRREASALKYRRRLYSVCNEVSAHLANFAARRRFAVVRYSDSDQRFCDRFPYEQLRRLVAEKLDAHGIAFERSGDAENPGTSRDITTGGK